ncbi:MAG: L,D-transpeptidase [Proteobacteria bacterium]|nr:L,D-transpeptidase [Pseudomonadota bacterium]
MRLVLGVCVLAMLAVSYMVGGCSMIEQPTSQLQYLVSEDVSKDRVLQTIASTELVVIVNVGSNRSTIIRDGVVVDQWNSVTGDITGNDHRLPEGDPVPKMTPYGIYTFDEIDHCPVWYPGAVLDEDSNTFVSFGADSPEYWKIINDNQDVYGPCGVNNPLGEYVVWFNNDYGYHGTAASTEWILRQSTVSNRRVSGGCIRNPPEKISMFFEMLIDEPELKSYKDSVNKNRQVHISHQQNLQSKQNEQQNVATDDSSQVVTPQTVTTRVADIIDAKIIVGNFKGDLPVQEDSGGLKTVKLDSQKTCTVVSEDVFTFENSSMMTPLRRYSRGDRVIVLEELSEDSLQRIKTTEGWMEASFVDSCSMQYSWLPHYIKRS